MSKNHARTPPPRQLTANETLETLSHWKTTLRTFYEKDDTYKVFFKKDYVWDNSKENFDLKDEEDGEMRKAADVSEDLEDLLNTLSGYLPHSYLTDKILNNTKNIEDVWRIIHEHYNVKITSESLLDFESLHKKSEETHRQFFERLLQHTKQHLAPKNVKVENFTTTEADKMSVSLMNMVALQWLRKTNSALIDIVKTEYSTELRSNVQLADLVPRIAPNIDSLLRRYDQGVVTAKVDAIDKFETVDATTSRVAKTWGRGADNSQFTRGRGAPGRGNSRGNRGQSGSGQQSGPFCPGCYYLSKQLGTTIHFRHTPGDCPRKAVTVKMFEMEDKEYFDEEVIDDEVSIGKIQASMKHHIVEIDKFQILKTNNKHVVAKSDVHDLNHHNNLVESVSLRTPIVKIDDNSKISDHKMDTNLVKRQSSQARGKENYLDNRWC